MSRNTDLSTVMFPVGTRPIGLLSEQSHEDEESSLGVETIDQYQAIVREDTGKISSIECLCFQASAN